MVYVQEELLVFEQNEDVKSSADIEENSLKVISGVMQ